MRISCISLNITPQKCHREHFAMAAIFEKISRRNIIFLKTNSASVHQKLENDSSFLRCFGIYNNILLQKNYIYIYIYIRDNFPGISTQVFIFRQYAVNHEYLFIRVLHQID